MEWTRSFAWLLSLVVAGCGLTHQSEPPPQQLQQPAAVRRVSRAELLERLRTPLSRSAHDLVWRRRADGGAGLRLQGRFQHAIVAHVDADGSLRASCVENMQAAAEALAPAERAP